mmetsp:Transcript_104446/g.302210  ORF Transcript_104446/g.302210 Transcript_104446/m.302210 type:complete len:257 (+) Transcript_104446:792-1562(+)
MLSSAVWISLEILRSFGGEATLRMAPTRPLRRAASMRSKTSGASSKNDFSYTLLLASKYSKPICCSSASATRLKASSPWPHRSRRCDFRYVLALRSGIWRNMPSCFTRNCMRPPTTFQPWSNTICSSCLSMARKCEMTLTYSPQSRFLRIWSRWSAFDILSSLQVFSTRSIGNNQPSFTLDRPERTVTSAPRRTASRKTVQDFTSLSNVAMPPSMTFAFEMLPSNSLRATSTCASKSTVDTFEGLSVMKVISMSVT